MLERHQLIASVVSTDLVLSLQRLLDRLDLGDDLPWEQPSNPLQSLRNAPPMAFINTPRDSLLDSVAENDELAIQTAQALGSKVNEVRHNPVVGHATYEEAYNLAVVEGEPDSDATDDGGFGSGPSTPKMALRASLSRPTTPPPREDPNEARVKKALQLRKQGNPREASYQLSIAAHHGSKNAMLLYGLSLRYGYGLRVDAKQSFAWICKAADFDATLDANHNFGIDPFNLTESSIPKVPPEPEAKAFFEIGVAYLNGIGVDKNENRALQFLEKSASLGEVEAMSQAGLLWQKKGQGRKKDLNRSAAWLRFAEARGAQSYGNSWIYKEKYMKRK